MPGIPWTLQNGIKTAAFPTARSESDVTFHDIDCEVRPRAFRIARSVLGVRGCVNERSGDMERSVMPAIRCRISPKPETSDMPEIYRLE